MNCDDTFSRFYTIPDRDRFTTAYTARYTHRRGDMPMI